MSFAAGQHKKAYVLSWLFDLGGGGTMRATDTYYFAYSFPYTYTDLQRYLCVCDG